MSASSHVLLAGLLVVGGLLACFIGHRIFRLVLAISGFVLGAVLMTAVILPTATGMKGIFAMILGGAVGAIVLVLAEFVGVALIGAASAAIVVHVVAAGVGGEPHALVVLACTVTGALVALAFQRYVIVFCTAFGGAWLLLVGALALWQPQVVTGAVDRTAGWLMSPLRLAPGQQWILLMWVLAGLLGTMVQLRLFARLRYRD